MTRIPINGIKLSGPLVPMRIRPQAGSASPVPILCRMLTEMRVNIAFMTAGDTQGRQPGLCCIDAGNYAEVAAAVHHNALLDASVTFDTEVGLLSFYPHQARMDLLVAALNALVEGNVAVHGFASSIAAVTFVVDYEHLDRSAALLGDCMALPTRPAAFRADFKVIQE
jgi:aspartokinase